MSYAAILDRDASDGRDCNVQQGCQKHAMTENQRFFEK
jgi:hypothetical protein